MVVVSCGRDDDAWCLFEAVFCPHVFQEGYCVVIFVLMLVWRAGGAYCEHCFVDGFCDYWRNVHLVASHWRVVG